MNQETNVKICKDMLIAPNRGRDFWKKNVRSSIKTDLYLKKKKRF